MKALSVIAAAFSLLAFQAAAHATSRSYPKLDQYIADSDAIALVEIAKPNEESAVTRSKEQPFGFASEAKALRTLKGELPKSFLIHHMSSLDDCLFQQGPGDYLVFIKRRGELYVPTDAWPSSKPIKDGYVIGWSDSQSWSVKHSLDEVVKRIEAAYPKSNPVVLPTKIYGWGWGKGSSSSFPESRLDAFKGKEFPQNGELSKAITSSFVSQDDRLVIVTIKNPNDYDVFFRGRQYQKYPTIRESWKTKKDGEWKVTARDFCGTGVRDKKLEAGKSMDILITLNFPEEKEQVWAWFYKESDPTIRSECLLFEEK